MKTIDDTEEITGVTAITRLLDIVLELLNNSDFQSFFTLAGANISAESGSSSRQAIARSMYASASWSSSSIFSAIVLMIFIESPYTVGASAEMICWVWATWDAFRLAMFS